MYCRNCGANVPNEAVVCTKCGVPKGQGNRFCPNCGKETVPGAVVCVNCGVSLNQAQTMNGAGQKSKLAAGLLGIFLGQLGIHNFYLGYTSKALVQLLVTVIASWFTCGIAGLAMWIWGLIEGIMILTGSIASDANGMPLKD